MRVVNLYKYIFLLGMAMSVIPIAYSQQAIDLVASRLQEQS